MSVSLEAAARIRPRLGETGAGDTAVIRQVDDGLVIGMVDVLGHGPEAHAVAVRIKEFLERSTATEPSTLMNGLHELLKGSARGAAAGICSISERDGMLRYVGHGNTRARRFWQRSTRLVSRDGLIGSAIRQHHEQSIKLAPGDIVLFYTDGVTDRFDLEDYRHAVSDTPRSLAHNVIEMFGKDHDDAACIALRIDE